MDGRTDYLLCEWAEQKEQQCVQSQRCHAFIKQNYSFIFLVTRKLFSFINFYVGIAVTPFSKWLHTLARTKTRTDLNAILLQWDDAFPASVLRQERETMELCGVAIVVVVVQDGDSLVLSAKPDFSSQRFFNRFFVKNLIGCIWYTQRPLFFLRQQQIVVL